MASKRHQAPAPIFNKNSKRPRLALVAHPGNSQPQHKEWSHEKPSCNGQPWTNYNPAPPQNSYTQNTSFSHHPCPTSISQGPSSYQQPVQAASNYPPSRPPTASNYQPSRPPTASNYQPRPPTSCRPYPPPGPPPPTQHTSYQTRFTPSYQQHSSSTTSYNRHSAAQAYQKKSVENSFPVYQKRPEAATTATQFERPFQSQHKQSENRPPPHTPQGSYTAAAPSSAVGQTATGQAVEPGQNNVAQTGRTVAKETKPRPSLRLLTATAQGMKHWATYKTHTPLLFEIYGKLTGGGVQCVRNGCKQFTLQASDGLVTCQFWEIDRPLPQLSVGGAHRVVGQWDDKMGVVKCFSVRGVRLGECESVGGCVQVSDKVMRAFVGTIHEN